MGAEEWPLWVSVGVFLVAGAVIGVAGWRLTRIADVLADRTGFGEALTGAVLLGASTSLPGSVASVTTAWEGHAELAVSNGLGGIAVQTMFLAIADMAHREANLEHAAASPTNILQSALLIVLLSLTLLAMLGPDLSVLGVHPISPLLVVTYLFGLRLARQTSAYPMWRPRRTRETREDVPSDDDGPFNETPTLSLWGQFALLAAVVGVAGWAVGRAGIALVGQTGMGESVVGALFTATTTSLPELMVSVAAVRQGALTMAVGNIMGGNAFDTLFTAASDVAYREGSIYHAVSEREMFVTALGMLLSGVLVMGLVRREKSGLGNIGFESMAILLLYVLGMVGLVVMS